MSLFFIEKIKSLFGVGLHSLYVIFHKRTDRKAALIIFLSVLFISTIFFVAFQKPDQFNEPMLVTIKPGSSLEVAAQTLEDAHIVKSSFWFKTFVWLRGGQTKIAAGDYYFEKPTNAFVVAGVVSVGDHNIVKKKITIPEGTTIAGIANILDKQLPNFDKAEFLQITKSDEGYLFPDTYIFPVNVAPQVIVNLMKNTFKSRIQDLEGAIKKSGHTLNEVIIMASILEEEGNNATNRAIISGILWKRIAIKMPLQVDAAFAYYNGIASHELTSENLKDDSEYNTYTRRGLPAGPITNPGLESIRAALNPVKTPYLYYLSDKAGVIHYAKDFEEHKLNKSLYLN